MEFVQKVYAMYKAKMSFKSIVKIVTTSKNIYPLQERLNACYDVHAQMSRLVDFGITTSKDTMEELKDLLITVNESIKDLENKKNSKSIPVSSYKFNRLENLLSTSNKNLNS